MWTQVARLDGWFKQRDNKMYPAWAYVFPTTILRLPYSLLVATLWCCIVYYPVGLAPEPGRHSLCLCPLPCGVTLISTECGIPLLHGCCEVHVSCLQALVSVAQCCQRLCELFWLSGTK